MSKIRGYRQISGTFGTIWWDGEQIFEIIAFEVKATPTREDVLQAMSMDVDSKMTGIRCEGSFRVKKVYSRGVAKLLAAWKSGRDPRSQLVGKLADPDSHGSERITIDNVWFNDLTLMQFELGQKLEREYPFGCTISDIDFPDLIPVQEG